MQDSPEKPVVPQIKPKTAAPMPYKPKKAKKKLTVPIRLDSLRKVELMPETTKTEDIDMSGTRWERQEKI